ncbi:MAG TPA: DUF4124 domain-containing protein [Gammaproteobacteria bacterium]|nr:DUF4124 domain-containing protein [Gammaproteobacteria bacterium]
MNQTQAMQKSQFYKAIFLTALLAMISGAGMAKTYKWVDSGGGIHYTQVPPYNRNADVISAGAGDESKPKTPDTKANKSSEPATDHKTAKPYSTLEQDKANAEAQKKAEVLQRKQTAEACDALRNNLKILKENAHIRIRSNENEKPHVLTPEERAQRIKQYNDSLNSMCK